MNTIVNKVKMLEAGHYLLPCDNCGKAMYAPEIKYWKAFPSGEYKYYCSADCSLAGHQRGYKENVIAA